MAATWKIRKDPDGEWSTLAALDITNLRIIFRNRAADEARIRIDGDYATAGGENFTYGDTYAISKNDTVVYRGRCEKIVRHGTGPTQYAEVILLGGWHWLTLKMLQQSWPMGASGTQTRKSRVILGAKYDSGQQQNVVVAANDQLRSIVSAVSSYISVGTIDVSARNVPMDERVDITCAEAIEAVLSWWPDAVVYFRYGSGTQINIKRVPGLASKTVALDTLAEEVEITARNDLCVPAVRLVYETVGNGYRNVHVDQSSTGNPDALGGLTQTISVEGSPPSWNIESAKITSQSLSASTNPSRPAALTAAWWAARIPQLAGWTDVTLPAATDTVTLPDGTTAPGRTVTLSDGTVASSWPPQLGTKPLHHELLGGAVEDWMGEKADRVKIQQYASYTLNGQTVENAVLSIEMTLTSAETGVYQRGKVRPPEEYPAQDGLASEMQSAAGKLYYEGSVVRIGDDPPELASVGECLNISGGAPEWQAMDTPVQSVEWDVGRGLTRVSFGPPNQVGKQDLVARARANRQRGAARSCGAMSSSSTDTDSDPSNGATGSVNTSVGGGRPSKIQVGGSGEFSTAQIDPRSISLLDHVGLGDDAAVVSELDSAHGPRTIISRQRTIPQEEGNGEGEGGDPATATDTVEMCIDATNPTVRLQRDDSTIVLKINALGMTVDLLTADGPSASLYCSPSGSRLSLKSSDNGPEAEVTSGGQIVLRQSGAATTITPGDYNRLLALLS